MHIEFGEPLTRESLKLFRKLGRVSFYHGRDEKGITVVEEQSRRDAQGNKLEKRHDFACPSAVKEIEYGERKDGRPPLAEVACCHHLMWTDNAGDEARYWRTITGILKPGDRLSLLWGRGYDSNGNCEGAGLFKDRLTLYVQRGEKWLTFVLPTPVCADNTARTIRRGPFNNE